jgi:uncharacterized protein YoxC
MSIKSRLRTVERYTGNWDVVVGEIRDELRDKIVSLQDDLHLAHRRINALEEEIATMSKAKGRVWNDRGAEQIRRQAEIGNAKIRQAQRRIASSAKAKNPPDVLSLDRCRR